MNVKSLRNTLKSGGVRAIAVILWIGLLGLIYLMMLEFWGALTHASWQTTTGQVIKNTEVTYRTRGGRYWSDFTYQYQVDAQEYTSERLWFFEPIISPTQEELQAVLDAYPRDSEITVTYSPLLPQQAVIFAEVKTRAWIGVVTAGFCIVPGFAFLFVLTLGLWDYGKNLKKKERGTIIDEL
ncbi:MAG: DUF3592 domain-containing protein [Chloroflexota bacterium]